MLALIAYMLALVESASKVVEVMAQELLVAGAILGFVAGIVSFVLSRYIWDQIQTNQNSLQLTRILILECVTTVRKVRKLITEADECLAKELSDGCSFSDVCSLYSGLAVSKPDTSPKELLRYAEPAQARQIGRFFGRWEELIELERSYKSSLERLLDCTARIEAQSPDLRYYELLAKEYRTQTIGNLKSIRRIAIILGRSSCAVFEHFFVVAKLGHIGPSSNSSWSDWTAFKEDKQKFQQMEL